MFQEFHKLEDILMKKFDFFYFLCYNKYKITGEYILFYILGVDILCYLQIDGLFPF